MNYLLLQLRKITKIAYKYRGLARIAEGIRKYYSHYQKNILVDDFDNSLAFYCALDEHMGSQIFWKGFYSGDQLNLLDRILNPDMIFLDVGANHGEFTVFAAKRLTEGHVIAFEPVSIFFEKLERNVKQNGFNNVTLINQGLGDSDTHITIYSRDERFEDGTKNEGLHSIYITKSCSRAFETIKIICLDDFIKSHQIPKVDVIKLDIEGAELAALRGAKETITRFRPIILIEVNEETCQAAGYPPRALLDYLSEIGYRFDLIIRNGITRSIIPDELDKFQNIICLPQIKSI
ncbi:FkbM family methyltransferase [Microcoleus sp. FACHB-831]|uniref:FkbM family methyltransferase n=1 Tax=Microcoleus sp. FACHB-831 TaxID=2692827 RepID=UPI001685EA14|nr:FkbM family methyltransferase [Microcoleus sp. FACHB-831]MBD1920405.1 FkbM family methyltransferase [Microcoleus sp. FACHB-831]